LSPRNDVATDPDRPLAAIFGCVGLSLSEAEVRFFKTANPLGFILFARNVSTPDQVRRLVADLRECVGRADAPILIDQEGGRVQRLRPPHWRAAPPGAVFGRLAALDRDLARRALRLNNRLIAAELAALGIDVDCTPVLDVPVPGAHDVIGDRAFGADPNMIGILGREVCEGMLDQGVVPIIKHIPGHGRAQVDSHKDLPLVSASRAELEQSDFRPFRALADAPWAMTAHVVYAAIDADNPATTSRRVIDEVIRGFIGFDGLLLSDDLSMQALNGSFAERASASLAAGCDVALHCNGDMAEMNAVLQGAAPMSDVAWERFTRGRAALRHLPPPAPAEALASLKTWLEMA
jgi:beta-N-acetylhexosaminidase